MEYHLQIRQRCLHRLSENNGAEFINIYYINSNEKILKSAGAAGIIIKGEGVQIIYGPNVNIVKTNLEDYLPDVPDELL